MFDLLIAFLNKNNWNYNILENKTALIFGITGNNSKLQCIAEIKEEKNQFVFFSIWPNHVPEDKRPQTIELLARLNYDTFMGNFEMDFSDGEIRYKTSLYYKNMLVSTEVLEFLILSNILAMDNALVGLLPLVFAKDTTVIDAYNKINTTAE